MTTTIDGLHLSVGKHKSPDDGMCLMEAVAFLAGEPHTDHPRCVSPTLAKFGRYLNDALPDATRQQLVPLAHRMVGTAGDGLDDARNWLAVDWLLRVYVPTWLDAAGLPTEATILRELVPVTNGESVAAAKPAIIFAWDTAWYAAQKALSNNTTPYKDTTWDISGDAARDIVWSVVNATATALHWDSPTDTEWNDIQDTINIGSDAARAAAGTAGLNGTRGVMDFTLSHVMDTFAPTITALQLSAIDLLNQMITGRNPTP